MSCTLPAAAQEAAVRAAAKAARALDGWRHFGCRITISTLYNLRCAQSREPPILATYYYETPTPPPPQPPKAAPQQPEVTTPPQLRSVRPPCAVRASHARRRRGERVRRHASDRCAVREGACGCAREAPVVRVAFGEGVGRSRSGPASIHSSTEVRLTFGR